MSEFIMMLRVRKVYERYIYLYIYMDIKIYKKFLFFYILHILRSFIH